MTLLYPAICIVQIQLMLTIGYLLILSQIWCSCIRYNLILNARFLNNTLVSISIRIQLYLCSQVSVLQDPTQSWTQGSSIIFIYLSRYNSRWHFVHVHETKDLAQLIYILGFIMLSRNRYKDVQVYKYGVYTIFITCIMSILLLSCLYHIYYTTVLSVLCLLNNRPVCILSILPLSCLHYSAAVLSECCSFCCLPCKLNGVGWRIKPV